MTRIVTALTTLGLLLPVLCSAQNPLSPTRLGIDRAELNRLLVQYDALARSTAYSDGLRDQGRARANSVRERLSVGDFRLGDQISLFIEGPGAIQWDTLIVQAGPLIEVPTLGPILLDGVLRSELEAHLSTELGRFIASPRVQARALIRVAMMGVALPGFYMMPVELPLSEAVMLAGGPAAGVDPGQIRVERGQDVLWSVADLLAQVAAGSTLDDLGLQAGDRIMLREGSAPISGGLSPIIVSTLVGVLTAIVINSVRN